MRWRRLLTTAVAVATLWSGVAAAPAQSHHGDVHEFDLGELRPSRPVFHDVADVSVQVAEIGGDGVRDNRACNPDSCWRYTFEVPPGAKELRVAGQASRRSDFWSMSVTDPGGNEVNGNAVDGGNFPLAYVPGGGYQSLQRWAIEHRFADPAQGSWTVEVTVQDTETGVADVGPIGFRFRAAVNPDPNGVAGPPNLRVRPPYEFGLAAPANPTSGGAVDRQNPAVSAAGVEPASCSWDEVLLAAEDNEAPLTRCLRFSVAVYEGGAGRLDLQLEGYDGGWNLTYEGRVLQQIHLRGGEIRTKDVGRWEFHMTHGHPHYLGLVDYQLYRVVDDDGTITLADPVRSTKTGFYTVDQRIADWTSFDQSPQRAPWSCGACIVLGAGWEDHYRWQRPGQYVPLEDGAAGDGLYVVRLVVNPGGSLEETSYDDNSAYALVRITGGSVEVCERGVGDHPWADDAQPVADEWPAVRGGTPGALSSCAV